MSENNTVAASDGVAKKVALHTLGCRLNASETGSIAQEFTKRGYEIVDFGENADVVFINTCTVTDQADSTCRNLIRKAYKSSPEGTVVVAGCYAQMEPEAIAAMQGVDLVLGSQEKYKVFDHLDEESEASIYVDESNEFWGAATTTADSHTRAFLKIQDGCNYICSYCIIPAARGRSRAISVADALADARELIGNGFKEIILTGVNIGEYETAAGEKLVDLIKGLFDISGLERLRLGSVEPNTMTDELIDVLQTSPKFLDHFHIPLQSGDDEILKSMRRKYTVQDYKDVITKIRSAFPNAGIGADAIVGYPGETDEQFKNTYNLMKELPISHFHVFPFSKRKGTTAAKADNHIHSAVKKERSKVLNLFGDAKLDLFSRGMIGETSEVLFEFRNKSGLYEGYTTNFVRVQVESSIDLKNSIKAVKIVDVENGKATGVIVE